MIVFDRLGSIDSGLALVPARRVRRTNHKEGTLMFESRVAVVVFSIRDWKKKLTCINIGINVYHEFI